MPRHRFTAEECQRAGRIGGKASGVTRSMFSKRDAKYKAGYAAGWHAGRSSSGVFEAIERLRVQLSEHRDVSFRLGCTYALDTLRAEIVRPPS